LVWTHSLKRPGYVEAMRRPGGRLGRLTQDDRSTFTLPRDPFDGDQARGLGDEDCPPPVGNAEVA